MSIMKEQLSFLYHQIKQGRISNENATEQLQSLLVAPDNSSERSSSSAQHDDRKLQERVELYFKKLLAPVILLPEGKIEADAPFEVYGIDSVMVMRLTDQLETVFGPLPKTLFFEYQNIKELSGFFLNAHRSKLEELLGTRQPEGEREDNSRKLTRSRRLQEASSKRLPVVSTTSAQSLDVAVIGLSGRYPGARNIHEFWDNLKNGRDSITEIPQSRWDFLLHASEQMSSSASGKWGGFLDGVDLFDPLFFHISPREAERIDPQERLFLESVYEVIEDAGYTRETVAGLPGTETAGSVGIFAGVMYQEYQLYGVESQLTGNEPFALNGNPASIANRVSYFCNFHGPSMVVDTMCSSSLTAIHLACQSLQKGECAVAVAGGVNVSIHPNKYVMLTQGSFLSSKGRCESFGEGGDGYVPGEGVGAALLKPLSRAIADGDHIYGIIKGTAVNHGGKTNGYTVPNPNRQASVISKAMKEAGVSPRSVSYIEAHGTGTSLGDPIEIAGLTKAFQEQTQDTGFCAIGSAKSNIGHCESAAGIAGVTKVLLQMKHRQLVPSIHSQPSNPNIDFEQTPFIVQQDLGDWIRPTVEMDGMMTEMPRVAGISSFGAGGANAHVVIEEYIPNKQAPPYAHEETADPHIIVLSAKNEERLRALAKQLLVAFQEQRYRDHQLEDISYTLQIGREAMEERLALLVESVADLTEKLGRFLEDGTEHDGTYIGRVKSSKEPLHRLSVDEDMQETILNWFRKRKYGRLLELWVNGMRLDWRILHRDGVRQRISLPTYPFARERYWVPAYEKKPSLQTASTPNGVAYLHPLLHQNTSDLMEQRYTTTFTGKEFFLADHVVKGSKMLPAVAYLEMARAAVKKAVGELSSEQTIVVLRQIAWSQPILLNDRTVEVNIGIQPGEDGELLFEIFTEPADRQKTEPVIHSYGSAALMDLTDPPSVDLRKLQARCSLNSLTKEACYKAFAELGLHYGQSHQSLDRVYVGQSEVLARLLLSPSLEVEKGHFVIHPAMADAALQASIGLWLGAKQDVLPLGQPAVPFAMERLEAFSPCSSVMWVHARYREGKPTLGLLQKLDIDMYDDLGKLCLRMYGVSSKILEAEQDTNKNAFDAETMLFVPEWKEQEIQPYRSITAFDQHIVMLSEQTSYLQEQMASELGDHVTVMTLGLSGDNSSQTNDNKMDVNFQQIAIEAFSEIQRLIRSKADDKILLQIVVRDQGQPPFFSALSGLLRTAVLENPKLYAQVIEVEPEVTVSVMAEKLKENSMSSEMHIRYHVGKRYVQSLHELPIPKKHKEFPWKAGGIYLITGGAGGLGLIFAREITAKVHNPVLILTGRSKLPDEKEQELRKLEQLGATIQYVQSDVSKRQSVSDLMKLIQQKYGMLHGIIHSAGVVKDNFILRKQLGEAEKVLSPKVGGTVLLDEASRDMELDFFILFSSLAGLFGNAGQADYALANAFVDCYAEYRSQLVKVGRRYGKTIALNWPLWQDGGMGLDLQTEQMLLASTGMKAMTTEAGLRMFYQAFHSDAHQVAVVQGHIPEIRSALSARWNANDRQQKRTSLVPVSAAPAKMDDLLRTLTSMAANILHVKPSELDEDVELDEYGFDQSMLTELSERVSRQFQIDFSSTLFIEYPTLQDVSTFLVDTYPDRFTGSVRVPNQNGASEDIAKHVLTEDTAAYLKKALATILKLSSSQIETNTPMEKYGIDSIMVIQLTKQLEAVFGTLSKTLFFEYQTIGELARYFVKSHRRTLIEILGVETSETPAAFDAEKNDTATVSTTRKSRKGREPRFTSVATKSSPKKAMDIAIIGLSGRYPQASNLEQYWDHLLNARDCITEIPQERWDYRLYADENSDQTKKASSKWGGFLNGVDCFDPLFFNISPKEAEMMDPQERLFLQSVYEALEDAGYTRENLGDDVGNRIGVYVGVMYEEYQLYGAQAQVLGHKKFALSGSPASIANRVSYFCNFHGPSMAIDTMCSSSLTAIHLACQSLQNDECEAAIAGGVNISVHPNKYIMLDQGGFLSSKGRCESFGADGDGYVPGEGVGAVILKPLSRAIADGDHIYGVIKGSAVNHGGKTNGYTVPNPNAQASVIRRAIAKSGIDARSISYLEAHGTGTSLGDPIEITGLCKAFAHDTEDRQFCAIGSVKSNIGHCESAAGIAGLTKVLLQMKHQHLVPSIHSDTLNPSIDFTTTPFVVQRHASEWKRPLINENGQMKEAPRRAGISSFGAGGANAHLIIEEYVPHKTSHSTPSRHPTVIVLSAKTEDRLQEQVKRLLDFLMNKNDNLTDIAFTLQIGREAMEERLGFLVQTTSELQEKLQAFLDGRSQEVEGIYRGNVKVHKETVALLTSTQAWDEVVRVWFEQRAFGKLLELWVKGLQLDWRPLYAEQVPFRVSLPTYPFAKERCWAPQQHTWLDANRLTTDQTTIETEYKNPLLMHNVAFLHKRWQLSSEGTSERSARESKGMVVILTSKETRQLASELAHFVTEPVILEEDQLQATWTPDENQWSRLAGVIDVTGCAMDATGHDQIHHGWLMSMQQWIEANSRNDLTLLFVTRGLESFKNNSIQWGGAWRAGLFRMLQSEYRRLRSRHMDGQLGTPDDVFARQIAAEFFGEYRDPEVCYRDGQRWCSYLSEMGPMHKVSQTVSPFPRDHALWITGGTRGLGLLCARHFVKQHGVTRLVLSGREAFPPREEWNLYENQHSTLADKIKAVMELEREGVHVQVLSPDLTSAEEIKQALVHIHETLGPVGGVIHCAGIVDDVNPAFIRKTADAVQRVMDPKVSGLAMMYDVLLKEPLRFFLLFSSVSSIIPSLAAGQSDYAMANAHMDYFAEAHANDCPIVSIQWPSWKQTGFGEIKGNAYKQTGMLSLSDAEGLQLLDQILANRLGPVVLPAVLDRKMSHPHSWMNSDHTQKPVTEATERLDWSTDQLYSFAVDWLRELFSTELKIEASRLDLDTPFQDYGMDSIYLAQVLVTMDRQLQGAAVDPTVILEYPTLQQLAFHLTRMYPTQLTNLFASTRAYTETSPTLTHALHQDGQVSNERHAKKIISRNDAHSAEKIAVIGIGCHFPDASNPVEFWSNLKQGKDSIRAMSDSRRSLIDCMGLANGERRLGAFLEDIDQFDPAYFQISDALAAQLDPLQRQLLEVSVEAATDAGYEKNDLWNTQTGVFVGARTSNFSSYLDKYGKETIVGIGQNFIAAHLSHFYNLKGPNMVIDTACSSSLTAIHLAVKSIQNGECDQAFAGGVDILLDDAPFVTLGAANVLSPNSRCKTFSANANGIGLGEGCGVILLKPLAKAIEDNNKIYGVIDGAAINNDGHTMGITTPNPEAQRELLEKAIQDAGIHPGEISYIEAHGTGTLIGDPIELKALTGVFATYTDDKQFCGVGSVKSNIGHLLSAAGIASFIKVLLSLVHQELPPTLHCDEPNPRFQFGDSPFYIVQKHQPWGDGTRVLRGGISAFGLGGNNAHIIVSNEGIPVSHMVRHPLTSPEVGFKRKRYWPNPAHVRAVESFFDHIKV
ncbi:SDR family NAD(P)-dependent oxidoreductase [Brevibacillus sp. NPDC003359]|uniref:SDR family NAD(P)-dependent oxidoreductase n=1 Tax=Brevibacillus sp. NPDC003359 TaxID=3363950 RepID=UPI003693F66C